MKSLFSLLAVALVALSSVNSLEAKALNPKVAAELKAALKDVDLNDQDAVNKAVLSVIAHFDTSAADITEAAVRQLSAALSPKAAATIVPALVAQIAKAYPADAGPIVQAAVTALPASLKADVAPSVVSASVEAASTNQTKVAILNSAITAVTGDPALVAKINSIAATNSLTADASGNFVAPVESADNSGSTGPVQSQTTSIPNGSSGSGSGSNNNNGTQPEPPPAS
jgi:hypothetical protein